MCDITHQVLQLIIKKSNKSLMKIEVHDKVITIFFSFIEVNCITLYLLMESVYRIFMLIKL